MTTLTPYYKYPSDFKNVIIHGNVIKNNNMNKECSVRCFRCDHIAEHHVYSGGCCWGFRQDNREYQCNCRLSIWDIIKQNKKLEYTFDLL